MKGTSVALSVTALVLGLICLGCGKDQPLSPAEKQNPMARLAKPAGMSAMGNQAVVAATVTQDGAPVEGVEVAFSRSVSGQAPDYKWKGTTDADGKVEVEITADDPQLWRVGASGYYTAKATDASGGVVGKWGSIPINGGRKIVLLLPVGGPAHISAQPLLPLSTSEIIALHHRHRNAVGSQDLDRLLSYFADDTVYDLISSPPLNGKAQVGAFFGAAFQAFPDFQTQPGIDLVLASENMVLAEHSFFETHLGEWQGIPATGKSITVPYLDIKEFDGDKLKHVLTYFDAVSQLVQMGVMSAPDPIELVPSFTLTDPEPTGFAPLEANGELLSRWNAHDAARWAQMIHPDADIFYGAIGIPMGRNEGVALQELFFRGFSDVRGEIVRMVDMGDGWVLVEAVFGGTQDGPYLGIPASGRYGEVRVAWIARSDADGMMTYYHCYFDNLTILRNMGVVQ